MLVIMLTDSCNTSAAVTAETRRLQPVFAL